MIKDSECLCAGTVANWVFILEGFGVPIPPNQGAIFKEQINVSVLTWSTKRERERERRLTDRSQFQSKIK